MVTTTRPRRVRRPDCEHTGLARPNCSCPPCLDDLIREHAPHLLAPMTLALIPAHNEEDEIEATLDAVTDQVDRVVVVADNCTDATVELAWGKGVLVFESEGNEDKKAGALNQALAEYLPGLAGYDRVLVLDADSHLAPDFIERATEHMEKRDLHAVGGVFSGRDGGGLVGWSQRNEYARYARDVKRINGKALCLTGTATVFSVACLREVIASRESRTVYDTTVLTEDFELTLRLKHLGYRILAPADCALTTEIMETWPDLHRQRLRWKRGAIQSLARYGLTRHTIGQWGRQAMTLVGLAVTTIYFGTLGYAIGTGNLGVAPLWLGVTGIFMVERAVTVRKRGLRHALAAALLLPEMIFDTVIQATHVRAVVMTMFRVKGEW